MDIDAINEHNGHFLVIETKRPGEEMLDGQRFTLEALGKLPNVTVVILQGDPGSPTELKYYRAKTEDWSEWERTSVDDLRRRCKKWDARTNGF